jgi:hypothetical protein
MNQNNSSLGFQPLLLMLMCFVVIIFSISQIINMARPVNNAVATTKLVDMVNNPYYKQVKDITQSQEQLNYKDLQAKFSASYPQSVFSSETFGINPQIEKLPVNEQNYLIRFKLLEWQLENIQNQLYEISTLNTEPLIFKVGFWIYAFLTWCVSIFLGRILTHYTDKFIQKNC